MGRRAVMLADNFAPLETWLSALLGGTARIVEATRLSGGAIQQNWLLRLSGVTPAEVVLRRDAAAGVAESHGRAAEYALLRAAAAAGVAVPAPLGLCEDPAVLGGPFLVMGKAEGLAFGPKVVKDVALFPDRAALARRPGGELARIHRIVPPRADLAFLGAPPSDPAAAEIARIRQALDALGAARPGLEWGLRWAERQKRAAPRMVLTHRDFRTGNYMLDASGPTAILDWEFAGWGDPMADLGWFCATCWRFGRPDLEAGGIGARSDFYAGYAAATGEPVDDAAVRYWEIVAHLRWAGIALAQGWRHASGAEPSLELALTGRLAAELELSVLRDTAPAGAQPIPARAVSAVPGRDLHPETGGGALLEAAQHWIQTAVLPRLAGEARFAALMVASAMRMAARDHATQGALRTSEDRRHALARAATPQELVGALRRGAHDDDASLHAALWADAALRTSLSKPAALTPQEHRAVGMQHADGTRSDAC